MKVRNDWDKELVLGCDYEVLHNYFIDTDILVDNLTDTSISEKDALAYYEYLMEIARETDVECILEIVNRETDRFGNGSLYYISEY